MCCSTQRDYTKCCGNSRWLDIALILRGARVPSEATFTCREGQFGTTIYLAFRPQVDGEKSVKYGHFREPLRRAGNTQVNWLKTAFTIREGGFHPLVN